MTIDKHLMVFLIFEQANLFDGNNKEIQKTSFII